jgi:cytoskeleton protein RodZ
MSGASASAGALLRAAREKKGLHIAALAAAIKVAPRKLDALENDRWEELPDATFIRALAQTVCRTLKIDDRPVLELLPQPQAVALEPANGGLNAPFRDRPGRNDSGLAGAAIRPMVWAAGALMLAALAVYFVPEGLWSGKSQPPVSVPIAATPAPASGAFAALSEAASAPAAGSAEVPAASAPGAAAQAAPTTADAASANAIEAPAVSGVAPALIAPMAAAAASTPAGLVQLRTTKASWIEVRDGRGQLLLSRTVFPGEDVGLDGGLPIRLTIGNAAATQLGFRGQPVDLAARTRDNVARVELQ